MIDEWLKTLSAIIVDTAWIAPIIALLAGLLTSFTPCALSSVPIIVSYVGGKGERTTKRAFQLSLTFAIGSAITFTILGVLATIAGKIIGIQSNWWYIILGILMMLMSLQIWEIYEIIPSNNLISKNQKKGFIGALIAGILAGIFSSPCSTPVLIALLAIVAEKGSLVWGIVLLLLYSVGHGILSVICGTSIGFVQKISQSEKYEKISRGLKIVMGIAIALIGLYMFYLAF